MKRLLAMLVLTAPLAAVAASNPDSSFFKNAAEAGISEVDAGNLAQQKATNDKVKDFAGMMVKDHTAAAEKLKALATTKGVDLPTTASIGQMASKAKLELLSGETFDKSYIKNQVSAHQATIKLFQKEATTGEDADAKAFAVATLPTLRAHMKAVKVLASASGVKAS